MTTLQVAPPADRQVVVFTLGADRYAVDVRRVQEIIRWVEPRSVSSSNPLVRGVINLRGRIIPVCDLGLAIGGDAVAGEDSCIVVIEAAAGICGVTVDGVDEVRTLVAAQIDMVPAFAAGCTFVDGVAKLQDALIVLIDPDALFAVIGADAALLVAA